MGFLKSIEKGDTGKSNEYWKRGNIFIDENAKNIYITFEGYGSKELRDEGKSPDDSKQVLLPLSDIFTKAQIDAITTRIYKRCTNSIPEIEKQYPEHIDPEDPEKKIDVVIGELNPFLGAEEA